MAEATKALERFLTALDNADWDGLRAAYAPTASIIFPGTGELNVDETVEVCEHFKTAFPDIHHDIVAAVATESGVGAEIVAVGTHTGPLAWPDGELAPTGRQVTFRAAQMVTTTPDNVIITHHIYYDQVDIMTQMGVMDGDDPG